MECRARALDARAAMQRCGADSGNRTRIVSLEGWGPAVGRCPPRATRRGIEPLSPHRQWSCDASRITGHESQAPAEGIEPSLRVLEARPVTMTLRPKSSATRIGKEVIALQSGHASIEAEAFGIEPMYSSPAFADGDP